MATDTRRRRVAIVAGLVFVIASVTALVVTGAEEPAETVEIALGDVYVDEDQQLIAAVSMSNGDALRHEIEVWLTVGQFGDSDAWSRRVAELTTHRIDLRSGEAEALDWEEPVAVPAGWYEVTAWARVDGGQVLQIQAPEAIQYLDSAPASRVATHGTRHVEVVTIDLDGGDFARIAGVVNGTAPGPVLVKVDLLGDVIGQPWWSSPAAATFVEETAPLEGNRISFGFDSMLPLGSGIYAVRIELWEGETLLDQILLGDRMTISEPSETIRRDQFPTGPLAIVSVELDADDLANTLATVEIQNLSDQPVEGLMWWLMAAPGDPTPWEFPDARSFEIGRRFEPFERRTVRLAIDGPPPTGQGFELSAWVHVLPPDSEDSVHSDGIRLRQLINAVEASDEGA